MSAHPAISLVPPLGSVMPSEEDLIRRAAARDPDAVGALYDRHHQAVRRLALRLLGDEALAEDVVHDVFVALPGALGRFEARSSLSTFVLGMTVNLARKKVRSAVRRRAAMERLALEPPERGHDPEREHRRRRLADELQRALAAPPPACTVAWCPPSTRRRRWDPAAPPSARRSSSAWSRSGTPPRCPSCSGCRAARSGPG